MANFLGLTRSLCPSMVVSLASFGKNSQSRTLPVLAAVAVAPFVASILHPHTRPLAAILFILVLYGARASSPSLF